MRQETAASTARWVGVMDAGKLLRKGDTERTAGRDEGRGERVRGRKKRKKSRRETDAEGATETEKEKMRARGRETQTKGRHWVARDRGSEKERK